MNRTALKRKTPLARSVWKRTTKPRAKSKRKSKYARRERAPEVWWLFVKSCPCSAFVAMASVFDPAMSATVRPWSITPCGGVVEADHDVANGLGRKSPDRDVWAICTVHHRERTDHTGAFKAFKKADMRAFRLWAIARTWALARYAGVEIPRC